MLVALSSTSSAAPRPLVVVLNKTIGGLSLIGLFAGGIKLSPAAGLSAALPYIVLTSASTVALLFSALNAACWRRQTRLVQNEAARPVPDVQVKGAADPDKGSRLSLYV